jgi:hypothetical protein
MDESTDSTQKFPLNPDQLTELVMQRLRINPLTFLPAASVIAQFCDVRLQPVGAWFVDPKAKPLGGTVTLKLWYFQQQMGVFCPEIDEVVKANPYGAAIGKLLAYDIITMSKARELCGNVKDGAVLNGARGGKTSNPKLTVAQLQSQFGGDLEAAIGMYREQLDSLQSGTPQATTTKPAEPTADTIDSDHPTVSTPGTAIGDQFSDSSREEIIESIIAQLIPRLEAVGNTATPPSKRAGQPMRYDTIRQIADSLAKAHTDVIYALRVLMPEELDCLKELVGEDLPFNLKNALAALCGSRAKQQITRGE